MKISEMIHSFADMLPGNRSAVLPTQEVAVSQDSQYSKMETLQYSPDDLLTKKKFDAYEKMMTDDQVNMSISALKLIRLSSGYEIEAASEDPRDIEIADFVGYVLENMQAGCNFHNVLFNLMGAIEIGWSMQEMVLQYIEQGPYTGKLGLKAIKSKNPKYFNISVDEFSNPQSVVSISSPEYGRKYPIDKFLLYSFQKKYENVFGTARLRSLYQWWWVKQTMIRAMGVYMEKFGLPIPIGKYPKNFTKTQQDDFLTALTKLRIEHALILPDGTTVEFKEATGKGSEAFLAIIEKADAQIAKVIMGQTLTTGAGKTTGSSKGEGGGVGTLGSIQFDILVMYLDYLGLDLATGPLATLIKRIVDFNYSGVFQYPTFKFKPLFPEDLSPQIDMFVKCVESQVIKSTPEDEEQLRKMLGFKGQSGNTAKLRPNKSINSPKPRTKPVSEYPAPPAGIGFAEHKYRRKLTAFEEKVDFPGVVEVQDEAVARILPDAQAAVKDMVDNCLNQVQKARVIEENKLSFINTLDLRGKGALNKLFTDELLSVAKIAARDARREIRSVAKHADLDWMTPEEVLKFIKSKAFWMTDVIVKRVLDTIKAELYNGIKTGKSYGDIFHSVQAAVEPYVGKPGVASDISEDLLAARLETAVRTNVAEAYNQSRDAVFTTPDMRDFVVAFQYSAVLDDRVRSNHETMDGRIYLATDPIWKTWTPPNGFNCRCMKIPITKYEKFTVSPPPPASVQPDQGFK
jgi:SPP1 gp7 family putative phage head morphogenesis protein